MKTPLVPLPWLENALKQLLEATLTAEQETAARDVEIAKIQGKYHARIIAAQTSCATLETEIEQFYREHRAKLEPPNKKSLDLQFGTVGLREPSNPSLVPLNEKWTDAKIRRKVKSLWGMKFFRKPPPPAIDKNALKRDRTPEQLAQAGLKLDDTEKFHLSLNRLAAADRLRAPAEAA